MRRTPPRTFPFGNPALLLEEALRKREFAFIEFSDSPVGRQAFLQGTRLAVWQVVALIQAYGGEIAAVAAHLDLPAVQVQAAQHYAAAYPDETAAALADQAEARSRLHHLIPTLQVVAVGADAPAL